MRRIVTLLVMTLLLACALPVAAPTAAPTLSPPRVTLSAPTTRALTPTTPPTATLAPSETPPPHTNVDAATMLHKLLMGYQGWFNCPGDGSQVNGYFHWFKNNTPDAAHFRVDMWPDMSELTPNEQCPTSLSYPDGQPAPVYSAYNPATVRRHFQWMSDYGVDGVFVQRFGSELDDPAHFDTRNVVTQNAQAGAEAYGRVFAIMYDTSGMDTATFVAKLEADWKYLVDVLQVTDSPAYLHHHGKPVLAIWGLGFTEHVGTPEQALELLNFFENNPDPKYQVTLLGGVPTWWRLLLNDSLTDPAWADYYCALNVISPWTVGRFRNSVEADNYKPVMAADLAAAAACGAEYMPVVFPGTSFHNDSGWPFNDTPRQGGNFYWRQVYNAVSIGAPMIYNAMFDEVDEGTAMYKLAATSADQPEGVDLVAMDTDGYGLPNDWYLQLAGAASQMLRGDLPLTADIPLAGAVAPQLPAGTYRLRLQLTTTSDWSTLTLNDGGTLGNLALVSASPEAINLGADGNRLSLGQPIDRANAGGSVDLIVEGYLSGLQAGTPLQFVLESGAIGDTTVRVFKYVDDAAVEVETRILNGTNLPFEIPAEAFIVSATTP